MLVLATVAWAQWRQSHLVSQALISGGDNSYHFLYQADNEYLRLREQWPRPSSSGGDAPDMAALQLRYDIFVSRIGVLHEAPRARMLVARPEIAAALTAAQAFIARADEMLGPGGGAVEPLRLAALYPELVQLDGPMRALTMSASDLVAASATQFMQAGVLQNRFGIAMTMVLGLLATGFSIFALRELGRAQERRRELEALTERLRMAQTAAESAAAVKTAFLANMSHEIRTPFQGLQGMLSLLGQTRLDARQAGHLSIAAASARHLLAIVNDVLDTSSLESGQLKINPTPVQPRELLVEVESLMRPQAEIKGLALHVQALAGLPQWALLDATRLRQVLFNLLANAIKFTDHGEVRLQAGLYVGAKAQALLRLTIRDSGIGMDDATRVRLFERFVQADASPTRRFGGTGLGLEISRSLVRLMGGDITVESRPGEGSTFTVDVPWVETLPAGLVRAADAPSSPAATGAADSGIEADHAAEASSCQDGRQSALPPAGASGSPAKRLKVLVAEDNEVNRLVMEALLQGMGHEVGFAVDGAEVVRVASRARWDVVLMDLHMPQLDGIAATRAIRASLQPHTASLPVVALTADVFAETRQRCADAGFLDFLAKPVDAEELRLCLERVGRGQGIGQPR